ncbi:MAG: bifunctional adenosylcobinamide kinase/adenosylcobinamide-phosphate guanylyltransferase [Syntrophomonadaceae bacterium]|jgi:adenosylcobinamide kinase/adenosylcobinamide-phosphate guanylyltransferase|nr:bifunctional adenosylcobinamide kinase/adenosylcobinamide-phosphate guanylyltransferase [Syntrophomonadaceae bacterium]MDH7497792.1 bifunctional adenosylcobinamide kinase/adenosylcobinamide-phosphate guanylyltransferase [Syntrophomonadaceae bacterium]
MGKVILVTGGARSGKSAFAERLLQEAGAPVLYVATAQACDEEMEERIRRHRARRPPHWRTLEGFAGLGDALRRDRQAGEAVLVDCLTVMITNLVLEADLDQAAEVLGPDTAAAVEARVAAEVEGLLQALAESEDTSVLVTNEVGMGLVPPHPLGRLFRDIAGRMNQLAAARADEVYLVACGIPLRLK